MGLRPISAPIAGSAPSDAAGRGGRADLSGGFGGKLKLERADLGLHPPCSPQAARPTGSGDSRCLRWQELEQKPFNKVKPTRSHPGLPHRGPSPGGNPPRAPAPTRNLNAVAFTFASVTLALLVVSPVVDVVVIVG